MQIGGAAPRRFRLSQAINNGDRIGRVNLLNSNPVSFLTVVPIAAPCYAVRLGFANEFNFTQKILSASVYASDTYSTALEAFSSSRVGIWPTNQGGLANGSAVYFDGMGDATLNVTGSLRHLTLPSSGGNLANEPRPYTISWSDWVPCTSLPRADGAKWPLLFVYITLGSRSFVSTASSYFELTKTANRGKKVVGGLRADVANIDFADNPRASTWSAFGTPAFGPWFVLQYLTLVPSVQIIMTGDSLTTAPPSDGISNAVWRAAADLSYAALPIEVLNLAWGATTWAVYNSLLQLNLAALQPSVIVPQIISRNGMGGVADMQKLIAMGILSAQAASSACGAKLIWNIPGCIPSWNGATELTEGFIDARNRLLEASAISGVPIIDAPRLIGDTERNAPWDYRQSPQVSDDGTHPNAIAQEMLVPSATAAVRAVIGS